MVRKVGNSNTTSFWLDKWVGYIPLSERFRRYIPFRIKKGKVGEVWRVWDGVGEWDLVWRRSPFIWEEYLILELVGLLHSVRWSETEDVWWWKPEEGGEYSVRLSYKVLEERLLLVDRPSAMEEGVFNYLWKRQAPSKVFVFSWMFLLDRIPTCGNLLI